MRVLALLALILLAAPAHADTIYSYVSDAFRFVQGVYAPWDRITGNFVLAEAFVPQQQLGAGIEAAVTARLQRATAWAARQRCCAPSGFRRPTTASTSTSRKCASRPARACRRWCFCSLRPR